MSSNAFGALLAAAKSGDSRAVEQLLAEIDPLIQYCVHANRIDPAVSTSDHLQNVRMRVAHRLCEFRGADDPEHNRRAFNAWVRAIVSSVCADHFRSCPPPAHIQVGPSSSQSENQLQLPDGGKTASQIAEENEDRQRVQDALARVPQDIREILVLHFYEGLSYREIADEMQISLHDVRTRFHRGLRALEKDLY